MLLHSQSGATALPFNAPFALLSPPVADPHHPAAPGTPLEVRHLGIKQKCNPSLKHPKATLFNPKNREPGLHSYIHLTWRRMKKVCVHSSSKRKGLNS